MTTKDLQNRLQPWLQRWSLGDAAGTAFAGTDDWLGKMTLATYSADEYLVHVGDVGDTLYLIDAGLVRLFYTSADGKERNKAFMTEGQVAGPVSAAITGTAAPFAIAALEPTVVLTFPYSGLLAAASKNPQVAQLHLNLLSNAFIRNEQREAMLLTLNAQQRYEWLLEHEKHLLDRVPQFHIASYLGVDAVSLSRLKRKLKT
ncbi:MAG: Crp/Fnr family transcriptional regulator [Halioglobus sp.]